MIRGYVWSTRKSDDNQQRLRYERADCDPATTSQATCRTSPARTRAGGTMQPASTPVARRTGRGRRRGGPPARRPSRPGASARRPSSIWRSFSRSVVCSPIARTSRTSIFAAPTGHGRWAEGHLPSSPAARPGPGAPAARGSASASATRSPSGAADDPCHVVQGLAGQRQRGTVEQHGSPW